MTRDEALKLRAIVEKAAESLDNKTAFEGKALFPNPKDAETFWDGHLITTGTRIRWKGELKFAMNDLWAYASNNPDNAPSLWDHISYKQGERIIPAVIPASLAFDKGEKGWYGDVLFISLIPANVWTPDENPAGWEAVTA